MILAKLKFSNFQKSTFLAIYYDFLGQIKIQK